MPRRPVRLQVNTEPTRRFLAISALWGASRRFETGVRRLCGECAAGVRARGAAAQSRYDFGHNSPTIEYLEGVSPRKRTEQQLLLEESYELALLRDADFPRLFYDILFRNHPSTRALFKSNSLNAQRTMLSKALLASIDHLEDPAWLEEHLAPLGHGHLAYGVTEEMYDWVGTSLVAAIAEVCDADWTGAHAAAWRDAYARISQIMRRAHA